MPFTRGFSTPLLLRRHARNHQAEVNAADEAHYLALADAFCGGPLGATIEECTRRSDGAIIRWDPVTDEYGILTADGFIKSYFVQDRTWHPAVSNRAYFEHDCRS